MNIYLQKKELDFTVAIDFFRRDIANLRTARVNLSILDNVRVEAYGVFNPINAVANLNLTEAKYIIITPWDKNIIKDLEKAIIQADLDLGIVNEGDKLRLSLPPLTEENRREIVKKLNEKMEKARINLRQLRDSVKEEIINDLENKNISEDEKFRFIKELDEFTVKKNEELKNLRDKKEKDIMEI